MRRHRWSFRLLAALLGLSLLAAACGGGDDDDGDTSAGGGESGRKEGGTSVTGEGLPEDTIVDYFTLSAANPNAIDPATADTRNGSQVTELIYDGLTNVGNTNELEPAVAEEWEGNDDGSVWTFTLRDDVTFSNDEQVTPTHFKESWERVLNPDLASSLAYHFLPIQGATELSEGAGEELTGVVADDEANTLEVTLVEPLADWPQIVSHTVFSPVPEAAYSVTNADEINQYDDGIMIGNGPYEMASPWEQNVQINLTANDAYYGEAAKTPNIEFRISADVTPAYQAFESGEGDTGIIAPGQFAAATEQYNNVTDPSFGVYYFAISWESPDLGGPDNLAVRQAISLAVDRDRINEQVYDSGRVNATGVTPPGIPGYEENLCGEFCEYDPERAQELVDEWGKADTMEPIGLQFNRGGGHEDVVNILQENLEAIGLRAEQDGRDGETYFDEMQQAGQCELCRAGWIWDYPSYYNGMYSLFNSVGIDGDNLGRFNVPEFDDASNAAARETDEDARDGLWQDAETVLFDNMGVIPINWYTNQLVYSDRLEGVVQNGLQSINYDEIEIAS